jgi:hypothetical protein
MGMSYKTDRLADLFPDVYAARETDSLLHKLLDAIGAEFMTADEKIKRLLKSHWVRYAEGTALDKLGAIYGVTRRTLRTGEPETDPAFRRRLQSTVDLFTGGGTRVAVLGAVRSALGLPFAIEQLNLPPEFRALRDDIEKLVVLTEFSPTGDRVIGTEVASVDDGTGPASELVLPVGATTVSESLPRIEWLFDRGPGRRLQLVRMDSGQGVKSLDSLLIPSGKMLVLTALEHGRLSAVLDGADVSAAFVNLDGTSPAVLPPAPATASNWKFRARGGVYGIGGFDSDAFDLPLFQVRLIRVRYQPLTFDVEVPYFLQQAVAALKKQHNYPAELFVFEGIPLEHIQEVVDQVRAAGVRGSVRFSLSFFDNHRQDDALKTLATFHGAEDAGGADSLLVANINQETESHDSTERLTIAGVFDISPFEGPFGFM